MFAPAVTVLMGVYNGRARLDRAIDSVRRQTFRDFEFLIFDDGSTDGSEAVLKGHAGADPRIRIVRHDENVGLGAVLRRGVELARANVIARMDADDESVPDRLERQLAFLQAHPDVDIVGSYAEDVASDGSVLRVRRVPTGHERIAALAWSNPFVHSTVMFRRQSVLRVGSYDARLRRRQDYDLWFRCVHAGLRLANIPEPLVRYRFTEETLRRSDLNAMWDQVRIGLRGCRLLGAPPHAYVGACLPLLEAALPLRIRMKLAAVKARMDPRGAS